MCGEISLTARLITPEMKSGEALKFRYIRRGMLWIPYTVTPLSFDTVFLSDRDGHITKTLCPLPARVVASLYVK